ncbi:MAG: large-conductance mechanosensitive channel protein MscL, partial [Phycisphaerales bacterium]|nr:large-conductance mechanosensitive channel protein MscL [Phycisphaerales bacterium]
FAVKGNVVDMAVGIIIGAAFGKIVSSFVGDVMMPPLGAVTGGVDFGDQKLVLREPVLGPDGAVVSPGASINYGSFINVVIDFVIVAFAVFLLVKAINTLRRKQEAAPAAPPPEKGPTPEQKLLTEIRDAIRAKG